MPLESGPRASAGRRLQLPKRLGRPSGCGHLGATTYRGRSVPRAAPSLSSPAGRAFGHEVVVRWRGVIAEGHAAIQVDLGESGCDVGLDEPFRVRHSLVRGELLPPVRAEVIPTQNDAPFRQPMTACHAQYELAKVGRDHSRVSTELVDLIRRGLHEEVVLIVERLQHSGLDDERMRGTDRVDAYALAGFVPPDSVHKRAAHDTDAPSGSAETWNLRDRYSLARQSRHVPGVGHAHRRDAPFVHMI